ncbi:MAG: sulfotransferase [Acidimicrobiia bacterium]
MHRTGRAQAVCIIRALMGTSDAPASGRAHDPFIFLMGHERSGTTMLRAMLDSHPDVAVPPEAHSVAAMLRGSEPLDLDRRLNEFATDKYFADWQLPVQSLEVLRHDPRVRTTADAVAGFYATYAAAHGKARYADKTPSHLVELELLADRFPNAQFLHIVRDGRDVAASMVTMDFGASQFAEAARTWRHKIMRAHGVGTALGSHRYLEIRYEDLVVDPEGTLRAACAFLGLEYTPAMLDYHRRADELLGGLRHTDHIQGIRRPPTVGIRDWHVDLTPHQIAIFDEIAGKGLDVLGYPRSGLRRSLPALTKAGTTELRMRARRARRVYSRRAGRRVRTALGRPTAGHRARTWTSPPAPDLEPALAITDLDVSVVIPAYNAAETLDAQLEALSAENYAGEWEILVSDNGSTDATAQIVAGWASHSPRIRLIDGSAGRGAACARNAGARAARGASLLFCDSDDIVTPGWVDAMASSLETHSFVCGPFELERLNPPWLVQAKGTTGTNGVVWFDDIFPFASSCNLGVRRDVFLALGGFDERIMVWEDVELSMRLFLKQVELHYVPEAAVHYRYRQTRREFFDRARAYGRCRPQIAERLRAYSGTQPSRWLGWRNWAWLIRHIGLLRTRTGQARWLWTAGLRVGALEGSWLVKRLYL